MELTEAQTTMLIVGLAFAAVLGPLTARSSNRREKIYGGIGSQVFNLLACMTFVSILPTVITGLLVGQGILGVIPVALSLALLSYGWLVLFALFEKPARTQALANKQEKGWTEADARTSGL